MSKKINIDDLVRQNIRDLVPYRSARDDFEEGVLLDANENSLGSPFPDAEMLNRYPSPYQRILRGKIAEYRGVKPENVFTGVGSDEAIDLLIRIFCTPGVDSILITPPTYGMYKVAANINDVRTDEVLLTPDFQIDVEATLSAITETTRIIFLCSPNNPTANSLNAADIEQIITSFNGIVVVDEAYIDFSSPPSFAKKVEEYPNLVVLQTLSKAFGLAGIRLGMAIADPAVITYMMKVKAPYNVNKLTSAAAIKAFDHINTVKKNVETIISERIRVMAALEEMQTIVKVHPSDANFVLFTMDDAKNIYKKLAAAGVVIRYRGHEPLCENGLRVTIGTETENNLFLTKLKEITG
jgi:histidinol-phosphate aminotransferase